MQKQDLEKLTQTQLNEICELMFIEDLNLSIDEIYTHYLEYKKGFLYDFSVVEFEQQIDDILRANTAKELFANIKVPSSILKQMEKIKKEDND